MFKFPITRLRRNRSDQWLRDLLIEHRLHPNDLILPLFVTHKNKKEAIKSLPGIYRHPIKDILKQTELAIKANIKAIALFPVVDDSLKTKDAKEAYNENNLICTSIREIRKKFGNKIGIIADVALDPYNSDGHDGIVINGEIDNDKTLELLSKQAITLANAGADIIAPSDMMDGRIGEIRKALDAKNFKNIKILSYAVKFSSNYYGPFRDAVGSAKNLRSSTKDSYQMSFNRNSEIIPEVKMDIKEGADMIMIKPALNYLDVIKTVRDEFHIPIFAYLVSGEYASLKSAGINGYINYEKAIIETLTSIKRSGAHAIFCYDALEVAGLLAKIS